MSKLYFRYAAMNAGKSTHLLQAAYNYEERGMRVRMFTAAHDDRSGVGVIGSRLGLKRQAETFGADTVFSIDEYLYAPSQNKLKFTSKISKGSLNYLSGVIAKLQPDAIKMTTPSGVIGVRGTQFLVKVEE